MRTSRIPTAPVLSTDGTAGPYITVGPQRLDSVRKSLDALGIGYTVDDAAVLQGGVPMLAVIDLGEGTDLDRVRQAIDHASATATPSRSGSNGTEEHERELILKGDGKNLDELTRRFDKLLPGEWKRRNDIEERMKGVRPQGPKSFCFSKAIHSIGREIALWLQTRGPSELVVTNVIPLQGQEALTAAQFNAALEDFRTSLIVPISNDLRLKTFTLVAPGPPTLENRLSVEALRRLKAFSSTANRSLLHPLDLSRWRSFIARAHFDRAEIDAHDISAWLEEEGWLEEQRNYLTELFEANRAVLDTYDDELLAR